MVEALALKRLVSAAIACGIYLCAEFCVKYGLLYELWIGSGFVPQVREIRHRAPLGHHMVASPLVHFTGKVFI
jgi:hypothetical protein